MNVRSANKGFTLVELLLTITVLSILSISSYLIVPVQMNKANDAHRKADLYQIMINLENYYSAAEQYPKKLPDCGQPLMYDNQSITTPIPCDPTTKKPYYYQIKGGNPQSYRLYALLSNTHDEAIKNVGCLGGCGPNCSFNYGVSSTNIGLARCSYVCAPGGGRLGSCELFQDTVISLCPKLYTNDATCNDECLFPKNRCNNASGKQIPY